jgi:DNA-binding MarR family transcriptional regulator
MDMPPDDPETQRISELAAQLRAVTGKIKRRLLAQSDNGNLTASQTAVLIRLERDGPATISALAKAEGMRPQSMGANIAQLEQAGLVSGAPDPADGRQTIVSVTPVFEEWIATGRAARQGWLFGAIRKNLSPAEQMQLAQALELLKRIADS